MSKKHRALDAILATQWAILPETLDTIAAIAEREHEYSGNLEALEAKLGRPLGNTMSASLRDGVALIPIEGPLFKRANLMTAYSGATSYEVVASDLAAALENPQVDAVMLMVDSPGGEVRGTTDLAAMIKAANKPVWAHVSGTAASAAYWLISAADKIFASDTSILGSIGAQIGYTARDPRPGERSVRFVSSVSPLKNADPESDAGGQQVQQMVDDLGKVFVSAVADNMGVSVETVLEKFGQGGVMVASKALESGMINGISTFESAFAALKKELSSMDYTSLTAAALAENRPDIVAALRAEGVASVEKIDAAAIRAEAAKAERERITAIDALAMPGAEEVIAKAKAEGTDANMAAVLVLKAVQAASATAGAKHVEGLKATEAALTPPASLEATKDKSEDPADAILAAGKAAGSIRV